MPPSGTIDEGIGFVSGRYDLALLLDPTKRQDNASLLRRSALSAAPAAISCFFPSLRNGEGRRSAERRWMLARHPFAPCERREQTFARRLLRPLRSGRRASRRSTAVLCASAFCLLKAWKRSTPSPAIVLSPQTGCEPAEDRARPYHAGSPPEGTPREPEQGYDYHPIGMLSSTSVRNAEGRVSNPPCLGARRSCEIARAFYSRFTRAIL